ncbi:hypothetical protein [Dactylosporangium maewongense]|uniref:hypothetical protein n=1 Tax=Dactylosporangium maewongense TaxID=634393 RepID=UPI0031CE8C2E
MDDYPADVRLHTLASAGKVAGGAHDIDAVRAVEGDRHRARHVDGRHRRDLRAYTDTVGDLIPTNPAPPEPPRSAYRLVERQQRRTTDTRTGPSPNGGRGRFLVPTLFAACRSGQQPRQALRLARDILLDGALRLFGLVLTLVLETHHASFGG